MVRVSSARGNLLAKAIVTNRFQPMNANGKTVHMIGLPWHFGWLVPKRGGDSANLLTAAVGDPNSAIPESKAFMVNIEKMPTHIAGLPVAVNINCHVTRHKMEVL